MSEPNSSFLTEDVPSSPSSSSSSSHPQQHRRHRSVILACVIVISLVGNAVLITMVALKWKIWTTEPPGTTNRPPGSQSSGVGVDPVCFTCNELGPGIESKDTMYDVIRLSSRQTLCCTRENNAISSLFQKIISDQYSLSQTGTQPESLTAVQHSDIRSTGAHLYMKPKRASPAMWSDTDLYNTAFCSGVECSEGNITIQEEGRYLVYSLFTVQDRHGLHTNRNLVHIIQRYNPKLHRLGNQTMLISKTSPTISQKPSFLSAILQLRRDDTLWASVPKMYYDFLEDGLFSNYFGVIRM